MADECTTACLLVDQVYDSCQQVVTVQYVDPAGSCTPPSVAHDATCDGAPSCTVFGTPTPTGTDNLYSFTVEVMQDMRYYCDTTQGPPHTAVGYATCVLSVPEGLAASDVVACFAFTPTQPDGTVDCGAMISQGSDGTILLTAQVCVEIKIVVLVQLQVLTLGPCIVPPGPQAECPVGPFLPPLGRSRISG